jgi:peptidoglycan/LPS O-acetylase OafA/YrhL
MSEQSRSKVYFPLLDVLRGVAALLVFAEHWRNLFFQDFAQLENPELMMKLFYVFTGAGHEAVMVFFVLSGCVIAHVVHTLHEKQKWSWGAYLTARLTRLWVVLIPALLLTAIWDQWGMYLSAEEDSIYAGTGFGNVLNDPVAEKSGVRVFFGNILFLQTILVPTFGSNGPLWSIAYEFVYYLLYPLIFVVLTGSKNWVTRFLAIIGGALLLLFAGERIAMSFPIWLAGVAAYWAFRKKSASPRAALPGFLIGCICLLVFIMGSRAGIKLSGIPLTWLLGICCAFTIYFGMSVKVSGGLTGILKPFDLLSSVSYSLYLLHMPLLVFIASLVFENSSLRWTPDPKHFAIALSLGLLVFGYSIFIWFFTENKTARIRSWVSSRLKE